jgi:hypothetical protein
VLYLYKAGDERPGTLMAEISNRGRQCGSDKGNKGTKIPEQI